MCFVIDFEARRRAHVAGGGGVGGFLVRDSVAGAEARRIVTLRLRRLVRMSGLEALWRVLGYGSPRRFDCALLNPRYSAVVQRCSLEA